MTDTPSHLFVVGPSRSGTALARSVLNAHPHIFLAGETHWFDDLRTTIHDPTASMGVDMRRKVEDHFLSLTDKPFGHGGDPEAGWLKREILREAAESLGASADSYFDAFLRLVAEHSGGAEITGEKTPRHIFRIDTILDRYRSARIVVMVRDPRAVVASYKDWNKLAEGTDTQEAERTRRTYDPTLLSALWRAQVRAGRQGASDHPGSVMIQRYEDLVVEPEPAVRALADFVGVDFAPEMLQVPLHNSSYSPTQWEAGISSAPVDRWKQHLDPAEVGVVQLVTRHEMERYGYTKLGVPHNRLATVSQLVRAPYRTTRAIASNRGRMGNPASYIAKRIRALLGI